MSTNPYEPGSSTIPLDLQKPTGIELADRVTRLLAKIVDAIIGAALSAPILFLTGYIQRVQAGTVSILEIILWTVVGFGFFVLVHGYFLATSGQTLGKKLLQIQIVDHATGALVPFVKLLFLREFLTALIASIPIVGGIYALADALFIFSSERRCLHDQIAGTRVVKVR
jgi:uncharacterized RDD family membrane protein YckC